MSALSAINYLFLILNFNAVSAGEPYLQTAWLYFDFGVPSQNYVAKVLNFIENLSDCSVK